MNTTTSTRGWPWGLIALALSALTWVALVVGVLAFTSGFRPPGDGDSGVQSTQWWVLGALVTMVLSFLGSLVAMVLAWRRRRGPIWAAIAGALLVMLVSMVLIVIGSSWG
ncbi:hypothetical protein I5U42_17885 [Stenotrophomonas maltophilia]|uniref:hypothetical protein n=1 Tax=Stenotrophomonas sp. RAC2 TaxID=3064902 RepID=UPI0013133822|nr:hypothetical protein [Stenotrophomonas sp. RAC2]MBH1433164.1 hypothetical protein [Stenotrophomonas maltophilia]MDV9042958.1 hypothetical protein [Stenotrophomonas sp. RAC2]